MQAKLPVLAVTDPNSDIDKVIVEGGFGWWCESNSVGEFAKVITKTTKKDTKNPGELSYQYLQENYTIEKGHSIISQRLK